VSDLFWPGDERAGVLMSDQALLEAMEAVERSWLTALVDTDLAPASARHPVQGLVGAADLDVLARGAEAGGNPVIGLVELLRDRLPTGPGRWLHRGLTSQDVLDTALILLARDVLLEVANQLHQQIQTLAGLAVAHRHTAMIGRTLTQHAVPITFGLKAASWLTGVLDSAEVVAAARSGLAVQLGGAAGTLAASTELARLRGADDPAAAAWELVQATAAGLGLTARTPWHTARGPITAIGDALVSCTDAWGLLASDVATLSRSEIAELAEGRGGGSSTMPGKRNPTLAVLIRRAGLAGPSLCATLHLAAAATVDERPDGAWHLEWATLRDLARRTVVAGSQTTELLTGLSVDPERMSARLEGSGPVTAEQQSMADLAGGRPSGSYLGATQLIIDTVLARAGAFSAKASEMGS
jgi:3-carboxy-cis,cis-muconate cycloisomerase